MSRIVFGQEARQLINQSLQRSVRAATAALGPDGRTILYDRAGQPKTALNGFEVAREAADEAGPNSIGARILKEALAEAQRELGDGTARLACVIGGAFDKGAELVQGGIAPGMLADAMLALQDRLETMLPTELQDARSARAIAIAAGVDPEIASAIAEALLHVGEDGAVDVQAGTRGKAAVETGTGFLLDAEPVSSWLPPATPADRLELARPHVLVVNDIISKLGRLEGLLDQFATRGKSLVIIARGASGAAQELLVVNGRLPGATLTALQPTAAGVGALAALEDVAMATGALVIGEATGTSLDTIRPSMLGHAERLVLSRRTAIFDQPAGARDAVSAYRAQLRQAHERQRYLALDRERLARREARLSGRWAELRVAGLTERDTERRMAAARAALIIVQAAAKGGVVPGAGGAFAALAASLSTAARNENVPAARAALICVAAGCRAVARASAGAPLSTNGPPLDPASITAGILRRAISTAATMLRIEAVVSS